MLPDAEAGPPAAPPREAETEAAAFDAGTAPAAAREGDPAAPGDRGPAAPPGEGDPAAPAEEGEGAEAPLDEAAGEPGLWAVLRDAYCRFDRRTLGFCRIWLGYLLLMDLVHRAPVWDDMYSNIGVLPNDVNLWRSGAFSFFNAFTSPRELAVLWLVMVINAVCLMIGYRTRLAQILALFFVTSMNDRVGLIMNGGYVVNNLLYLWTAFLPLGDRLSVDALLASMRARREATEAELNDRSTRLSPHAASPHTTALGPVLLLQLSAVYFFNVLHKTGADWHNGRAVHFVLYTDRMVTPLVAHVRDHLPNWAVSFMTRSTIGFESAISLGLLSPLGRAWARRAAIFMINSLHLAFGVSMTLGPFAWSLCVFSTLLFGTEDWQAAEQAMRRAHRARTVVYPRGSGFALWLCRILRRLDGFEQLTFRAGDGPRFAVETPAGARLGGAEALADVIAALPLGPAVAWALRLPIVKPAAGAVLGWLARRDLSATLGLRLPSHGSIAPPPAPLRRKAGRFVAGLREAAILVMFAAAVNQAMVELWVIKNRIHVPQPEPMLTLSTKVNFSQGWFMFCPGPVVDDGTIVVDAVTVDGRHVDPFTGREPRSDILGVKSLMDDLRSGQIWGDYFNRMQMPGNSGYRDAMKAYILRYPQRTGHPEDAIVAADIYWVHDMNPPWNSVESYKPEKTKIFSFDNRPGG